MTDYFGGARKLSVGIVCALILCSCSRGTVSAEDTVEQNRIVSVIRAERKTLQRNLTVSSELVPFQQIDVFAKVAGFIRKLNVDYGTRVRTGQVMAVLEIPELEMQLEEDRAEIQDAASQVSRAHEERNRVEAEHQVAHLEFSRLDQVAKSNPGLVAQQEVDDQRAKDLASEAQLAAATSAVASAESQLNRAQAGLRRSQALFDYSKITAPFSGVVTQRYANLGTLIQSGTNSSTQALPLVRLSQDDLFRLVIPIAESYVPYVRIGDPVDVRVPSLDRNFPGKVTRYSVDVDTSTRTMHTEVDVPNPERVLVPGSYAEATVRLESHKGTLAIPPEAVIEQGARRLVWVVNSDDVVEQREISLGIETPNDVEVLSGLNAGEMIAVGDRNGLKSGEKVQPKEVRLLQYRPDKDNRQDK